MKFDNKVHLSESDDNGSKSSKSSFPSRDSCRVLIVGCGTSRLGEDMMRDGWTGGIANVDFSGKAIKLMNAKYNDAMYRKINSVYKQRKDKEKEEFPSLSSRSENNGNKIKHIPEMTFECADITEGLQSFEDGSYDLIICKGTLDSILCSNGAILKTKQMMEECHRLLDSKHGALFVVSYGAPEDRRVYFENEEDEWWPNINIHKVAKRPQGNAMIEGVNSK